MQNTQLPTRKELRARVKELCRPAGKETLKLIEKLIRPFLRIERPYNATHSADAYFYTLIHSAFTRYSAETSSAVLNDYLRVPSPDQLLRTFSYPAGMLDTMREGVLCGITALSKKYGAFREPTIIAIDFCDIPYYGNHNSLNVVGTKHKAGTNYAHSFACCDAVVKGERFCLATLPRRMKDEDAKLVENMLETVLEQVSVSIALLDREFFQVSVIKLLYAHGLKFILPATDTPEIKRLKYENRHYLPCVLDYTMRSKTSTVSMKLVLVKRDDEIYGFITNLNWEPEEIAAYYGNRWGTETNNRKRNEFRALTTTQRYEIRYLYYLLAVALHNLWVLLNLVIAHRVYGMPTVPLVTTYRIKEYVLAEIRTRPA